MTNHEMKNPDAISVSLGKPGLKKDQIRLNKSLGASDSSVNASKAVNLLDAAVELAVLAGRVHPVVGAGVGLFKLGTMARDIANRVPELLTAAGTLSVGISQYTSVKDILRAQARLEARRFLQQSLDNVNAEIGNSSGAFGSNVDGVIPFLIPMLGNAQKILEDNEEFDNSIRRGFAAAERVRAVGAEISSFERIFLNDPVSKGPPENLSFIQSKFAPLVARLTASQGDLAGTLLAIAPGADIADRLSAFNAPFNRQVADFNALLFNRFGLPPYADGGVAGGHVASLSGGFGLDAFVPLPGGRRIPVSLNFGGSGFGGAGGFGGGAAGGGGPGGLADSIESLAARSAASLGRGLGGALSRVISGTESAGESFKRFGLDVLGQFKNIALGALRTSLFGPGGSGGGKGGGIAGSLFGSLVNGLFNAATKQANGGVMTVGGPLALRRYAAGGVA